MRRTIVSNLVSLDGFFEGPNNELDWHVIDAEFFDYAKDMLRNAGTLVFGAATYEMMAAYWPTAAPDEIAEKMNGLPKIVFSQKLQEADWSNTTLIRNNAGEEISRLKQQPGKDIVILGSAKLASSLLQLGMIDEYRVILNPVLIGQGKPLFPSVTGRIRMKLISTRTFESGVVVLSYQKA